MRGFIYVIVGLATAGLGFSQDWHREHITFGMIEARAKALAETPYVAPDLGKVPAWVKSLNYDEYLSITNNRDYQLWGEGGIELRAMFLHPGYLYPEPVAINEFSDTHVQKVRLAKGYFNYGHLTENLGDLSADGGFSGFKLLAQINSENFDEVAVFQGASYWRALGKGQWHGASARGIAINTGVEGEKEQFPRFREFWLQKPSPGQKNATVYGLMDGESVTGAYSFKVTPGDETVIDVRAVIFARKDVKRLGIAPMSSMFWQGENTNREFDDFRPEVHDSDGLVINTGKNERIWRPLTNDTELLEFSFFTMDHCNGFGLMQRDRKFESYEDAEALYEKRPSIWNEPTSDWGKGDVMLMEIPTVNEMEDNIVAMWVPENPLKAGERREYSYRQRWTLSGNPGNAMGTVVATRKARNVWHKEQRMMVVDFVGVELAEGEDFPEAVIEVGGKGAGTVKIDTVNVQKKPDGSLRLTFYITPVGPNAKLADVHDVELRAMLKKGNNYLTETWVYRIKP